MSLKIWPKMHNYQKAITLFDIAYSVRSPISIEFDYLLAKNDLLEITCTYTTMDRTKPTVGGYSSNEEMCYVFIYYYPRIKQFSLCLSQPNYAPIVKKFKSNTSTLLSNSYVEILQQVKWETNKTELFKNFIENETHFNGFCGDNSGSSFRIYNTARYSPIKNNTVKSKMENLIMFFIMLFQNNFVFEK